MAAVPRMMIEAMLRSTDPIVSARCLRRSLTRTGLPSKIVRVRSRMRSDIVPSAIRRVIRVIVRFTMRRSSSAMVTHRTIFSTSVIRLSPSSHSAVGAGDVGVVAGVPGQLASHADGLRQ